jgi:hypothetical protein
MSGISQNAIQKTKCLTQSNKVEIDTSIARKIAKDLISGDFCKKEIELVRSNLDLTKREVSLKDSVINTLGKQKDGLNLIISKKDEMFTKQKEISDTFEKELSKQKGTAFIYKMLSLLGIISTTFFIIKH